MSYRSERSEFGNFTKLEIFNEDRSVLLEIIPEKGAKVNRLVLLTNSQSYGVIDGYTTPEEVEENAYSKSSLLAPFPNRIADGTYQFEGKTYQLPINMPEEHNAIHGYIEHESFEVTLVQEVENGCVVELRHVSEGCEGYPFPFTITVRYTLSESKLHFEFMVVNTGNTNMPFGFGWHPYFTLGGAVEDIELKLPAVKEIVVDERLIPTGEKKAFVEFSELHRLENTKFDTGFTCADGQKKVILHERTKKIQLELDMGDKESIWQYVQVFTPPQDSIAKNTLAVEPMTCEANAFNTGEGLKVLKPGEELGDAFRVKVTELL